MGDSDIFNEPKRRCNLRFPDKQTIEKIKANYSKKKVNPAAIRIRSFKHCHSNSPNSNRVLKRAIQKYSNSPYRNKPNLLSQPVTERLIIKLRERY